MERIAQSVPKPCYAVEFDLTSQVCRECEFQKSCFDALGSRKHRITLDNVVFKFVPRSYGLDNISVDDPELPTLERTFILCHRTIFGHRPKDKISQHKSSLLENVKKAHCSIRMFMLANMVAYQQQQRSVAEQTERGERSHYPPKLFTFANSVSRVEMFREMCQKEFGTFTLSSLETLTEGNYVENDIERRMEHSEFTAARTMIGYKIYNGGPGDKNLYDRQELALDPHWLATEDTYMNTVYKKYLEGDKGSKMLASHRYSVSQARANMKKKRDWAIAVFQAREHVMPGVVERVLHSFGYRPKDFEVENEPVTEPMNFWISIARAIQHVECLRYIDGDRSVFKR